MNTRAQSKRYSMGYSAVHELRVYAMVPEELDRVNRFVANPST